MQQKFDSKHYTDDDGNPAGGTVCIYSEDGSVLEEFKWQNGPLGRGEDRKPSNGLFVETLIAVVVDRIGHYQSTRFVCRENALALTKLQEALHWLQHRTADREKRDVEGTHRK